MTTHAKRTCPNCGVVESRWTVAGQEHVNLSPITGQCVDCLSAMSKEFGPPDQSAFEFDPRAAAANDRGDA